MKAKINRGNHAKIRPVDDFSSIDPSKIKLKGLEGPKMTIYEYNQSLMANENPLPAEILSQKIKEVIYDYTFKNIGNNCEQTHFMLLCKDINYYTIFNYIEGEEALSSAFLDCIKNVGEVLSIELNTENNTPEIWVRTPNGDNLCMYYFNCENLVVPFGG